MAETSATPRTRYGERTICLYFEQDPKYVPETVNTDGWSGTQLAWATLFPAIALIRCFLHAYLSIRDRSKNLKALFFDIGERVWNVYYAETRVIMGQRFGV